MKRLVTVLGIVLTAAGAAEGSEADAKNGQLLWSAFTCGEYASEAGDNAEAARLFQVGYSAGQAFLKSLEAGRVTKEDRNSIPVAVLMELRGPTTEFILGRLYEFATSDAYQAMYMRDTSGIPLQPDHYVDDPDLKKLIATNKFTDGNCGVVG
jgi:hypothetical protein